MTVVTREELAECFEHDELRGRSPIRGFTPEERRAIAAALRSSKGTEGAELNAEAIKERIAEGDGFWRSCSGCYQTEDGQNVHGYPHSSVFGCVLGSGCSECGGIGAVWDTTDYAHMGAELAKGLATPAPEAPATREGEQIARDVIISYFDEHGINDARAGAFNILDRMKDVGLSLSTASQPPASEAESRGAKSRDLVERLRVMAACLPEQSSIFIEAANEIAALSPDQGRPA